MLRLESAREPIVDLTTRDQIKQFVNGDIDETRVFPSFGLAYRALAARVSAAGEPWLSAFVPGELVAAAQRCGFRAVRDVDPEDLHEVMTAYQAVCEETVRAFDGHVAQYLGDGIVAYFGYPRAHEDDARRAIYAGLKLVDELAKVSERFTNFRPA